LSTNLLLRFPGRGHLASRTTAVRAEQGADHTLVITPTIENTGDLHAKPTGQVVIRDSAGHALVRRALVPANVLPGARREFPVIVAKQLPPGDYTATVAAGFGARRSTAAAPFSLVGPNVLPTAHIQLAPLPTPRVAPGESFTEPIVTWNTGTAPVAAASVAYRLTGPDGGSTVRHGSLTLDALGAGAKSDQGLRLPGLRAGAYVLTATVTMDGREVARDRVEFSPRAQPGAWDRTRDWIAGHTGLVVLGVGLIGLAVVLGLVLYIVRLRRSVGR
jgi:hypothetical protein